MSENEHLFEWTLEVTKMNVYGTEVVLRTPAVVVAPTSGVAVSRARAAFGSTWDSFRKFHSHRVLIVSMREVQG